MCLSCGSGITFKLDTNGLAAKQLSADSISLGLPNQGAVRQPRKNSAEFSGTSAGVSRFVMISL